MRWLLKLLGPALLIVLVTNTDTDAIVSALKGVDPLRFLQAAGCWVAIAAIKAWRWQLLLAGQSIPLPYTKALQWYLAGLFLGGISPGRLGELIKVSFVRDLGHPMGRALFSSVLDRLFDLIVLPLVVLCAKDALQADVLVRRQKARDADRAWRGRVASAAAAAAGRKQ